MKENRLVKLLASSSDIFLAFFMVIIFMVIIIPIPPAVIDVLVATNITISIGLLMVALYIQKAVNLSVFPSILLITTIFRLSIEISATRQILLHANAGKVIYNFGHFVVGGNYIIGIIIFLIITIVQFIVVTKGAERVAEVAARFTLDAMPGKQMSIDADLRSGVIDSNQARLLRLALAKESQLYGAMDGAMKFVKGDVIASIIIAAINIVGGLLIGIFAHHYSPMQSVHIYTLLSIGGGLVTQIPSLLVSLTAGIVTTRVSSEKKDANLGREISLQILAQPKALLIASGVLLLMGFIKGFPFWVFFLLGTGIGSLGLYQFLKIQREQKRLEATGEPAHIETDIEGHAVVGGKSADYALTLPVILELGARLSGFVKKDRSGMNFIDETIPKMRHALYQDLGIRFPGIHVRTDSQTLADDEYTISLNEVPIVRGKVPNGQLLTNATEETLKRYNLPFSKSQSAIGHAALWVEEKYREILKKAGIKFWEPLEVVVLHLSYFCKMNASEFLGIQEVRALLEFFERSYPDLVKEVTRLVPMQKLTEIFRRLVQEQISIRDLRTILEALSEWSQTEKDTVILTEYVRSSLKRYVSYKYSQGRSVLAGYLLDHEIEDMVRGGIKQTNAGSYLALDTDSSQLILHAMRKMITPTPAGGQSPVLITAIDVRRFVRKLIEGEFPDLPVISIQEIVPEIRIQPLGRIQLT